MPMPINYGIVIPELNANENHLHLRARKRPELNLWPFYTGAGRLGVAADPSYNLVIFFGVIVAADYFLLRLLIALHAWSTYRVSICYHGEHY